MRAEIFSIGTELLLGQIVDTNAAFIAQRLAEVGVPLFYKSTVGDNPERLRAELQRGYDRSDIIICTGGLGPTEDDITAAGIAAVWGAPLEIFPEAQEFVEGIFRSRGFTLTANQLKQAMLPAGAVMIPNPVGTAPGFMLTVDGRTAVVLPGPPNEMGPMWRATVAPYLQARSGQVITSRTLRFCGIGEGSLELKLRDVIHAQDNPTVAPYAKTGEVHIRITALAGTEAAARTLIAPVEVRIREIAGEYIYGVDEETLEEAIGITLRARGLTLAVAESCTGGLLGGRITAVPGSSDYFLGGIISYSNEVKMKLLGVSPATLEAHGAVSTETAIEMAVGATRATGADIGISITGVAGPGGGSAKKPVGTVYIGIAVPGLAPRALRADLWGDRTTIRQRAVQRALLELRRLLTSMEGN